MKRPDKKYSLQKAYRQFRCSFIFFAHTTKAHGQQSTMKITFEFESVGGNGEANPKKYYVYHKKTEQHIGK